MSELPKGWRVATVGEVCLPKVLQGAPKEEFVYVDIGSVDNQRKSIVEPSRVSAKAAPSRARQMLRHGDVLVSLTRPTLNAVAVVPESLDGSVGSTGFDVLRAIGCEPAWLFAFVRSPSFVERMSGLVQGALYPAVRPRDVRETALPLPPLNEQRRIVAKLGAIQARSRRAREALDAVPPLLERLRQSILAAAFRGDLTADWRAKNKDVEPASKLLERIRTERRKKWEESELAKLKAKGKPPTDDKWKSKYKEPVPVDTTGLPELPEGWCWASVEDVSARVTDGTHQSPAFTTSGIPFLVIANVIRGQIDWTSVGKWVSRETYEENTARCRPERGDVLYTAVGSYGVALAVDGDEEFMFQRHIAHIKPLGEVVEPSFLALVLNAPQSKARADAVARGVAQKTVTLGELARFPIPIPPIAEQQAIRDVVAERLQTLATGFAGHRDLISNLAFLDRSTLAKAFRGELVPQDPNDNPAATMLASSDAPAASTTKPKRGRPRARSAHG